VPARIEAKTEAEAEVKTEETTMDPSMSLIAGITVDGGAAGYAQQIHAGPHRLVSDEPESSGGTGTGATPYSLLLAGLGACTSITLRMYAGRKGWDLGTIHLQLRMLRGKDGAERIERQIRFGAALTAEQQARLAEIADKTPVTKTIAAGTRIETTVAAGPG
jgi:putative redox protein